MGVRENKVEKYLHDETERHGGTTRKWVSPGRDGVPDRIVFLNHRIYFVEVKTVDGVESEIQERERIRLTEHGADVRIVYGAKGVNEFINRVLNND